MKFNASQLFTRCLEEGDVSKLRAVNRRLFNEIELPIYDYIFEYVRKYHAIPTVEILVSDTSFIPSPTSAPLDYVFDGAVNSLIERFLKISLSEADNPYTKDFIKDVHDVISVTFEERLIYNEVNPEVYFTEQKILKTTQTPYIKSSLGDIVADDFILFVGRMKNQKTHTSMLLILDLLLNGYNGILFSNEISPRRYAAKLDAIVAGTIFKEGFNSNVFRTREATPEIRSILEKAKQYRQENLGTLDIRSVIRSTDELYSATNTAEFDVDFIVIDGLHLMGSSVSTVSDKAQSMRNISNNTKIFALEKQTPVIAVSQSGRGAVGKEKGDTTTIALSDALAQDATVVYETRVQTDIAPELLRKLENQYGDIITLAKVNTIVSREVEGSDVEPAYLVTSWAKTRCGYETKAKDVAQEFILDEDDDNDPLGTLDIDLDD